MPSFKLFILVLNFISHIVIDCITVKAIRLLCHIFLFNLQKISQVN